MRLRTALALPAGTATAAVLAAALLASPATADDTPAADRPAAPPAAREQGDAVPADRQPTCGKSTDPGFPIETRIHGGPRTVQAGSGFQGWRIDLTNTTRELCHHIHPVVVLTGTPLAPDRVAVEFRDGDAGRWRPVTLERTSEDELVGAFDDGFRGFVVPADGTVTVPVRFSLAAGTAPGEVTVNAAVVQRRGDDGDWVGASEDYHLTVTEGTARPSGSAESQEPDPDVDGDADRDPGTARPSGTPEASSPPWLPEQLASTGAGTGVRVLAAAATLALGTGIALLVLRRRVAPRSRR
ncbi:hypothetical protein [Streptomyces sp. NPDC005805]|uniref:hypothetical protein n=1 Tax=Streptomyces sp. NPDC005805 TaxID=3157068 RepID=UPI003403E1D0